MFSVEVYGSYLGLVKVFEVKEELKDEVELEVGWGGLYFKEKKKLCGLEVL